jgi:hypothetical protein
MEKPRVYSNTIDDVKDLIEGEIYRMTFGWYAATDHDTELIVIITKVSIVHKHLYYKVIMIRRLIENSHNENLDDYFRVGQELFWNINNDESSFMKFDEYQDYENYLKEKEI